MRTWQEEAEMLLSLLNCFVLEREAVFASSEFFTGKRFYDLCLEHDVRTPEELEKKLGPEYKNRLLTKNKEQGMHFARKLHEWGHKTVLTPVAFDARPLKHGRKWSGSEYMGFWDLVIAKKCHMVCLNEFWQFSDSCVFHYLAGLKAGQKLLDHAGNLVLFDRARKIVISAVRRLEDYGFNVPNLHEALREHRSLLWVEFEPSSVATLQKHMNEEAVVELQKAVQLSGGSPACIANRRKHDVAGQKTS